MKKLRLKKMPKTTITKAKSPNPTTETKIRIRQILDRIRKNWQKDEIVDWVKSEYSVSDITARKYYHDAQKILQDNLPDPELVDKIRNEQIARVTALARKADEQGDTKNALKALDMLNKIAGLYTEKQEVNVTSDTIKFTFDS